jgi:hypothetical protein
MDAAAIHVGCGRTEEEAWAVGYQIERALKSGRVLALEFDGDVEATPELFDILLITLQEARERGLVVEAKNPPAWLRFAVEKPDGSPAFACAG